jgi:hypothetical protein
MLIQIVSIASVAAAQEVLCAHAHIRRVCHATDMALRGVAAVRASFKPTIEIYPAVTLCLIDVRGLCSMPSSETGTGRELRAASVIRKNSRKFRLARPAA